MKIEWSDDSTSPSNWRTITFAGVKLVIFRDCDTSIWQAYACVGEHGAPTWAAVDDLYSLESAKAAAQNAGRLVADGRLVRASAELAEATRSAEAWGVADD